jgi:hypothetical protein
MRCLYCGKELALLKRWTGGGEFCSDAHRQRYQEEYNQLALNRLLQAKPPSKPEEAPVASEARSARPVEAAKEVSAYTPPSPARVSAPLPPPASLRPVEKTPEAIPKADAAPAPAERAGFFIEMPIAAASQAPMSRPNLEFVGALAASLPSRVVQPINPGTHTPGTHTPGTDTARSDPYEPELAGLVAYEPHQRASNCFPAAARERKLEVREFVRTAPVIEIHLTRAGEAGLETTSEAMDILIFPQPPKGLPALWQEPPVGFEAWATELGALARAAFPTTGFSGEEPAREPDQTVAAALLEEAPVVVVLVPPPPEPEPVAVQAPVPKPATKPLPLFIQGSGPGKGKPLQVFSSAAKAVEAQVPRSTSLPLRPLMTFGPAPIKSEARIEPKRPSPAPLRPDPRQAPTKPRAAAEVPVKEAASLKPDLKRDRKPEVKEPLKLKEEPTPGTVLPAPLAAPYPGSNELGLPHLTLPSSPGFLGQIPILAKIAIVLALLAGLGGLIAYSSKSGGAATTSGGTIVAGSALSAGESGWITDWGATPGIRSTRQISILRSSQTLTDYRIEMQGQIESKAIGWVFRAADPKNFYVTKLEIVKPGLEPTIALVRFAIINGEEQAHAQLPLSIKARLDTMYKIRFDALGNRFTTYVQDQKVDDWTDDRVKTGGVGFYRERGEDATLKGGMNVAPLVVRK